MRIAWMTAAALGFTAAPAAAMDTWQCRTEDEQGGVTAILEQYFFGPDEPILPPRQTVYAHAGGIRFHAGSGPIRPSRDEAPPDLISLGIELPARPATRRVILYAPGVAPIRLRGHIWPPNTAPPGTVFWIRDRARILALLQNRDWTALFQDGEGRVQFVVPFRMPADLETMRALRERQMMRMREMARNPAGHCTHQPDVDEEGII